MAENEGIDLNFPDVFPVILLSGLSGSGKSSVLNVFEDMRFFTIDGLPLELISQMLPLLSKESLVNYRGLVLGMDLSQQQFASDLLQKVISLRGKGDNIRLLFVDAELETIMRRYATTRRPHPLEAEGFGLEQAIMLERDRLSLLRNIADQVMDTSRFSIHDLRRFIQKNCANIFEKHRNFRVHLISFGFKYGMPSDADMVYDLRFLQNPYFVEDLRPLSGLDSAIVDYVIGNEPGLGFVKRLKDFLVYLLPLYESEGRYRLTVAFGCTGGRHRSVAVTEEAAKILKAADYAVSVEHRHLELG